MMRISSSLDVRDDGDLLLTVLSFPTVGKFTVSTFEWHQLFKMSFGQEGWRHALLYIRRVVFPHRKGGESFTLLPLIQSIGFTNVQSHNHCLVQLKQTKKIFVKANTGLLPNMCSCSHEHDPGSCSTCSWLQHAKNSVTDR